MAGNKRYDARTDANQSELVRHIERLPRCEVLDLSGVGNGCTDLLVQKKDKYGHPQLFLIEVKTKKGKLNPKQVKFHAKFKCHIVRTVEDLWRVLGI